MSGKEENRIGFENWSLPDDLSYQISITSSLTRDSEMNGRTGNSSHHGMRPAIAEGEDALRPTLDVESGSMISSPNIRPKASGIRTGPSAQTTKITVQGEENGEHSKSLLRRLSGKMSEKVSDLVERVPVQSRKKLLIWGCIGLSMIIGGIIAVAVLAGKKTQDEDPPLPETIEVEQDDSVATTPREKALLEIFEETSPSGLFEEGTPQYNAREWMFHSDALKLTATDNKSRERIRQRYALAVFFYATNGPETWSSNNWLEGDECSNLYWTGISCSDEDEVRALAFDDDGLQGTIPQEIGALTHLENLILKNHPDLQGRIPTTIGMMSVLGQLGLYNNALTGGIPRELYDATRLNYINLQNNDLEGQLILRIERLRNLERLILFNNRFSGGLPVRQLARTGLRFLGLSNNKFAGTIPEQISNLPLLEYLYIDNNEFTGTLTPNLGRLTNLKSLNIDRNSFTGTIPPEFSHMRALEFASLKENRLSGPLPSNLNSLQLLRTLNIARNSITGRIPRLDGMNELQNLHLFQNQLTGSIPLSLSTLQKLEVLFLSSNQLSGTIPNSINQLGNNLRGLYLSDNRFQGTLPAALCALDELHSMFLDTNIFVGTIPECFGTLTALRQLYVFNNQLSGQIPESIGSLRQLSGLGFENNNLVGDVPEEICTIRGLSNIWADCAPPNPEVSCRCCTTCCPSDQCRDPANY